MSAGGQGCLIVSGTPGAGKTTVTRLVAAALPRSARLDGDDVSMMVVNGGVGPVSEPAMEARRQLLLRARNLCSLANNFADAGFYPVLDHVVPDRQTLDLMLELLCPRPALLVTLAPSLEVARRRNTSRSPREQVRYDVAGLRAEMERELGAVGWWFDTSDMAPGATAQAILAQAGSRAVAAPG